MAHFFIRRPVFAWVIAIVIMLGGALAIVTLSISQYPDIAPTTVRVSATYNGASAETVEKSVTTIIEDGMTGLDDLTYMTSSSSTGSAEVTLTFGNSILPDIAQVQVQNKLQLVQSQLPDTVQQRGIQVSRSTSSILMVGALISTDGKRNSADLGDVFSSRVEDQIKRLEGVGSINVFGSEYAMRIWLDPFKLNKYQLTTADVTGAIESQNTQVSVGSLGAVPAVQGQQLNVTVTAQSQLTTVADFESVILKVEKDGATVRLSDVARIEIGQETYGGDSRSNGRPSAGFAVNLATGANALDTAARVKSALTAVEGSLPAGVSIEYPYDTTPFVKLSIEKVVHTLIEAIILVFVVLLVFLQNLRATFIPMIAVPVVLLGTFGILAVTGYSINTLTMFAMVLAIGLLVDDAIVVVENVERIMSEEGLSPVEATEKSMGEITGAIIGIALVLTAVFIPHGLLWRIDWYHLSPVLDHDRFGHAAFGGGRHRSDAGAVRNNAEAHRPYQKAAWTGCLVQPRLRQDDGRLCFVDRLSAEAAPARDDSFPDRRRRLRLVLHQTAKLLPPTGRSGRAADDHPDTDRFEHRTHQRGGKTGRKLLP